MKRVSQMIVTELDPFMAGHGFKYIKSRKTFLRRTDYGYDDFVISIDDFGDYIGGMYGLGQRHNKVQELWDVLGLIYGGEKYKKQAGTIFRGLGEYFPFDPERDKPLELFFTSLEADAADFVARVKAMFETDGFAWYKRYSDPATLSRDVNDPTDYDGPQKAHPLVNNYEGRILTGVAVACVGEPERVSQLVKDYIAGMETNDRYYGRNDQIAPKIAAQLDILVNRAKKLGYRVS